MPTSEKELERLESRIRRLEDMEAIRKLLAVYCSALDVWDIPTLKTLFSREARLAVPTWNMEFHGRDTILQFFEEHSHSEWRDLRHYFANLAIEPAGEGYKSFAYFHESASLGNDSVIGWGTLEDEFTFEDNAWKISSRIITVMALTPITKGWAGADKVMSL